MKKLIKKLCKFIGKILLFFDKLLITPVMKVVLKITDFFKNNSKNAEKFLTSKKALLVISLLIAFLAFYKLDKDSNIMMNNYAERLYGEPVTAIYNEEAYVVEGLPKTADVVLIGNKSNIFLAKQYPTKGISLDLRELSVGTHKVQLKYSQSFSFVDYTIDPSYVTVVIYDKISGTREVNYEILHRESLDSTKNNYVACLIYNNNSYAIAISDISTGLFNLYESSSYKDICSFIYKYSPSELITSSELSSDKLLINLSNNIGMIIYNINEDIDYTNANNVVREQFNNCDVIQDKPNMIIVSSILIDYIKDNQKASSNQINTITLIDNKKYMSIDYSSSKNLELFENISSGEKKGSLLWVLDKCKSSLGTRYLRKIIDNPLLDSKEIIKRNTFVEKLCDNLIYLSTLRENLSQINDIERITSRIIAKRATPRELIALKYSFKTFPNIFDIISNIDCKLSNEFKNEFDLLEDVYKLIDNTISEEDDVNLDKGNVIKPGANQEIDNLRNIKNNSKEILTEIEQKEITNTGISKLRIKYNRVFGYFIEVTKSNIDKVPDYYIRKQILTNSERYIIPELKELEDKILNAQDKLIYLEKQLYNELLGQISTTIIRIQKMSEIIAYIDVLASFAYVANNNNYVKPIINNDNIIDVKDSRHPVIELINKEERFIPNDIYLDDKNHNFGVITGPNMAGKSTYMRQAALIILMAQIGSFVPASSATIGIVDKIFTRVGASDDLASGRSTFMVEMTEVANIIDNATSKSLIILDEIGRGTSTYDGFSIALAVMQYILKHIKAKTLFATHYHELVNYKNENINFLTTQINEENGNIVFLRKIIEGYSDKSYGIHVAKLAGLNKEITDNATSILNNINDTSLSNKEFNDNNEPSTNTQEQDEDSLFNKEIIDRISAINLNNLTPIEAMQNLDMIQKMIKENKNGN